MTPKRIDELLDLCGPDWADGQRSLVRTAMWCCANEALALYKLQLLEYQMQLQERLSRAVQD